MKKWIPLTMIVLLSIAGHSAAQPSPDERQALRADLQKVFDIVPLSGAVGLRPKASMGDVRLIEVADTIAVNGSIVSGAELRARVGPAAEAILRLSYFDAESRRLFLEPVAPGSAAEQELSPPTALVVTDTPEPRDEPRRARRSRRTGGDRVRIFGDVHVPEGETLSGQAVAVMGSVRIDGEVDDQVVAVMGSVVLGPKAVVHGDVVSVGGRIRQAEGAVIRGDITEVALGVGFRPPTPSMPEVHVPGWVKFWDGGGALPRLLRSVFRIMLLALLALVTLLLARPVVESAAERMSESPGYATLVGASAMLLAGPVLVLASVLLAVSVVGIPLLLALPFVVLALLFVALAGFSGTAAALGAWLRRRLNLPGGSPYVDVALGVVVIFLPLLLARLIGFAGGFATPFAWLLVFVAFCVEFLAWSAGFGAVLANAFGRWQSRRQANVVPPPPPPPVPASVVPPPPPEPSF